MKTASAFTKGMLELEGELTPILVSLVHREKETIHMLDPSGNAEIKQELDVSPLPPSLPPSLPPLPPFSLTIMSASSSPSK
jgi:hypothetical protein